MLEIQTKRDSINQKENEFYSNIPFPSFPKPRFNARLSAKQKAISELPQALV